MADKTVTRDNLGAWLLRCNPGTWDIASFVDAGGKDITDWSVTSGYRSELMEPGDRVLFWVMGTDKIYRRGIWGFGYVSGFAEDTVEDEDGYWLNEDARYAAKYGIAVDIPLYTDAVTHEQLLASGIDDLEVQRQRQGKNPSWVSKDQLALLEPLLHALPDYKEPGKPITISPRGAGFGTPAQNAIVERAAMDAVIAHYAGWSCRDVSMDKVGWDIEFTHQSGEVAKVEVKGLSGSRPTVLLTVNELNAAKTDPEWILALVTRALDDEQRTINEYDGPTAITAAQPYVFRADLAAAQLIVFETVPAD